MRDDPFNVRTVAFVALVFLVVPIAAQITTPKRPPERSYDRGMPAKLNHTIVHSRDKRAAADFYSAVLGVAKPVRFGPFLEVTTSNEVTLAFLDFTEADGELMMQHYAFLVSEPEFDEVFGRVKARGLEYWADPMLAKKGEINRHDGGRGVYFKDPSGHLLEIITRPYGSGG